MRRLAILLLFVASAAGAETLGWDAVTQYTDGTPIVGKTVYYQAVWSEKQDLSAPKNLGSQTTATQVSFTPATEGMPPGSWVYLSCKALVDGVASDLAAPLAWDVAKKKPVPPGRLKKVQ